MIDLLEILLEEAFDTVSQTQGSIVRQLSFPQTKDIIKVAIGMRRSGKTYFL